MTKEEIRQLYEEFSRPGETAGEAFERVTAIIRFLLSEDGCPWDRVQTHESLRKYMIEETYEVIDAINAKDADHLEEELGDFILQAIYHGLLGEREGSFDLTSVLNRVSDKMLFRHPHVFFAENIEKSSKTLDNALVRWENMKQRERSEKTQTQLMSEIPKELPALMRSDKIQKKARDVGFDWDDVKDAFAKVREETDELEEIYDTSDKQHILEEVGDLLFSVVNVARFLDVDPEEALSFTSGKFVRRFGYIEEMARSQGRELTSMTLDEMDRLWEEAKARE
ncbi:MAG: nucleoside triphosphate pyrophosphohydrolase [Firmicutes bacterium]|jgi:tetrapyrrole methylase family protein/MazG family protein|nr:nucleoside triphosphate pyrophosphohydrolase [Bacillota bacterium]